MKKKNGKKSKTRTFKVPGAVAVAVLVFTVIGVAVTARRAVGML